jgi:FKBP-type peptidyl-prolyl cis-trans isomerase
LKGLAIGVASMNVGESAVLHVGYQLAYGEEGSFSFPNVPPRADVIYEVELIGFEEAKEVSFLCIQVSKS